MDLEIVTHGGPLPHLGDWPQFPGTSTLGATSESTFCRSSCLPFQWCPFLYFLCLWRGTSSLWHPPFSIFPSYTPAWFFPSGPLPTLTLHMLILGAPPSLTIYTWFLILGFAVKMPPDTAQVPQSCEHAEVRLRVPAAHWVPIVCMAFHVICVNLQNWTAS